MGSLEVHAEYNDGIRFRYIGARWGEKNYCLFGVLGDPLFKNYAEPDPGSPIRRLKSERGLPHNVCAEIEKRASQSTDDEISSRWIWFEKLDAPWWNEVSTSGATDVHGPRDHQEFRTAGRICTATPYDEQTQERLSSSGFRLVTPTEMDAIVASNPSLLEDPHQADGKVYALARPRLWRNDCGSQLRAPGFGARSSAVRSVLSSSSRHETASVSYWIGRAKL
jgi:hypothetical protein